MFFNKKENNEPVVLATQDFQSFVDALMVQFSHFTTTKNSAYSLGIILGKAIKEANPREYSVIINKLSQGMQKGILD
jgi:hypothetical protein